jgi:hypothetical protein
MQPGFFYSSAFNDASLQKTGFAIWQGFFITFNACNIY